MNKIITIAAINKSNAIGLNNELLYHDKDDMKHFYNTTKNSIVLMGMNTYNSLPVTHLKNRINVIMSRSQPYKIAPLNGIIVNNFNQVLRVQQETKKDIYIIGGEQIYNQFLHLSDELILTIFKEDKKGNKFFPKYKDLFKNVVSEVEYDNFTIIKLRK